MLPSDLTPEDPTEHPQGAFSSKVKRLRNQSTVVGNVPISCGSRTRSVNAAP